MQTTLLRTLVEARIVSHHDIWEDTMANDQQDYYDGLAGRSPASGNYNSPRYNDGKQLQEIRENADYSFEGFQNLALNVAYLTALVVLAAAAAAAWKAAEPAIAEWARVAGRFAPYWMFALGVWAATASGEIAARTLLTLALISVELVAFMHLHLTAIALSAAVLWVVWFKPFREPCPSLAVRLAAFGIVAAAVAASGVAGRFAAAGYGLMIGLHLIGVSLGLWMTARGRAVPTATKALMATAAVGALAMRFILP